MVLLQSSTVPARWRHFVFGQTYWWVLILQGAGNDWSRCVRSGLALLRLSNLGGFHSPMVATYRETGLDLDPRDGGSPPPLLRLVDLVPGVGLGPPNRLSRESGQPLACGKEMRQR